MLTVTAQTKRGALSDRAALSNRAALPVPAYSAAVFRIVFGLLGVYGSARFIWKGWVETLYLEPTLHLTYRHFGWVRVWPQAWMYAHVVAVGLAALALAVGYRSRVAAALYFFGFGYLELIDGALYLNHYWWVTLAAGWLVVLPVHNTWAVSNLSLRSLFAGSTQRRRPHRSTVPALTVWILRGQLSVVYMFAGLAKLNPDWLLDGNPLSIWLAPDFPPWAGLLASWAGMGFDCTIVGWLLWSKSRPFAYVAVITFHTVTGMLFQIGLFPWVMIAGTLVFFAPDWPVRLGRRFRIGRTDEAVGGVSSEAGSKQVSVLLVLAGIVACVQLIVPLRHFASPGNVRWTEEGYYLSWRVMLTEKTGTLRFEVRDPDSGEVWRVRPEDILTDWQSRQASIRSDLLLQAAHLVADDFAERGIDDVEVYAESFVSFNSRRRQRYADPAVDLASLPRGAPAHDWILPLEDPIYD